MPPVEDPHRPLRVAIMRTRRLPRRSLLGAALLAPVLPRLARAADVITWRLGHSAPADFPLHVRLVEAAGTIGVQSEGQMRLEVYPNGALGGPVGLLSQVRAGTLDVAPMTNQLLASNLGVAALPMVGFAFDRYELVWSALDGDLGTYLRDGMRDRLGLVAMQMSWNFGFRQVTTSGKVVKVAGDIEGLRLRTPPEADFVGLLQALKALPVTVPLSQLESALRSHAVDGQEGVLPLVAVAKLYQDQTVCALSNHVWDGHWICVSGRAWSNLPAKLKDIVAAAFNESGLHQRQDIVANETRIQQELQAKGMKFNAVDAKSFRQVLRKAGYYDAWQKKMGDDGWAALEKYTGRLT
jgi:TRAP-type transport system periplasmic protein